MFDDARCTRENALKFLGTRDFDPETAAMAFTAMRDATPEQVDPDGFVENGCDSPIKHHAPPLLPPRLDLGPAAPAPLVVKSGTVTLADGTVLNSSFAAAPALPPRPLEYCVATARMASVSSAVRASPKWFVATSVHMASGSVS